MIEAYIALAVLIVAFIYAKLVAQPSKLMDLYTSEFQKNGYKVHCLPKNFMSYPGLMMMLRESEKGDAFGLQKQLFASNDIIIGNCLNKVELKLIEPSMIKKFIEHQQDFTYIKRQMLVRNLKRVVGDGLTFSEKQKWKKHRKIMSKVFSFEFVAKKHNQILHICDQALDQVQANAPVHCHTPKTYQYDIMDFSSLFTSNVITTCFLGGGAENQAIEGQSISRFLIDLINDVNIQGSSPLSLILGPKFLKLGVRKKDRDINRRIRLFDEWGSSYIDSKIKIAKANIQANPQKIPDNMIEAIILNNQKVGEEERIENHDILQQFKNFMLAGTDTTSHYIQVLIGYLCMNPECEKLLREEIDREIEHDDLSFESLKKLKYLQAIEKETTRMYGPVNFCFPRVVEKDHVIGGVKIFTGTLISYNMMGIHYNPKWYKEPYKFRPERWLNGQCDEKNQYLLLGFGAGARGCIGKRLAIMETKIALVKLMKRYSGMKMLAEKMQFKWKFLYVPDSFDVQLTLAP